MPKVLNKYTMKSDDAGVNIMRPSKWGNPFIIGKHGDRDDVIMKYKAHINNHPTLKQQAKIELKGKNLVCCCAPLACHGDILLAIANGD